VRWDPYMCKNYTCLVNRGHTKGCKDCFYMEGKERLRWLADNDGSGFSIDVIFLKILAHLVLF
jgi:hypothetical protein